MSPREIAVITGASSGIGTGFAHAFAARGHDVVLTARRRDELETLAAAIATQHGVGAHVVAGDLTDAATLDALAAQCATLGGPVRMLVNNAGFGYHGGIETESTANAAAMIRLNIEALVATTQRFLPGMLARKNGGIINVASVAAFQPIPYMAVYGASKAFVLSFSDAVGEECRGRGVRVLALCPGATATPFFSIAGEGAAGGLPAKRSVDQVIATALHAYDAGKSVVVDGAGNSLLSLSSRFLPRRMQTKIVASMMKPK